MKIGYRTRRRGMLERILGEKRAEVARMLAGPPLPPRRAPRGSVLDALARAPGAPLRIAAEIKRRSPSAGELSAALSPAERAKAYARGGAAMISVLSDRAFFGGGHDDLAACRDALDAAFGEARPRLLCKDFVIDPVQLDRAIDAGADAVLLIARILDAAELGKLVNAARSRGLEPLVEVVTEAELEAALAAGARLVGVNARDLDTLRVDPDRAARVLAGVRGRAVTLHLSGLATPADVARVASGPADGALVGEALLREDDPEPLLSAMIRAADAASGRGEP